MEVGDKVISVYRGEGIIIQKDFGDNMPYKVCYGEDNISGWWETGASIKLVEEAPEEEEEKEKFQLGDKITDNRGRYGNVVSINDTCYGVSFRGHTVLWEKDICTAAGILKDVPEPEFPLGLFATVALEELGMLQEETERMRHIITPAESGGDESFLHAVKRDALDVQIGGSHYKDMKIQPIEFCFKNNLNVCQGKVIKYVTRYKNKNGLEDLKKAKHMIDLLIELEYGDAE